MFRPLLADKVDLARLQYPCFASPKYDGFRCLINKSGEPVSRNLKPIANSYVFGKIKEMKLPCLDGELLTYTGDRLDDFNTVQSKLSSRSGMPDFKLMYFDRWDTPNEPFDVRYHKLIDYDVYRAPEPRLQLVVQQIVENEEQLLDYEAKCLSDGWEGVMVRSFDGIYKFGRSSVREGYLLKLKRFFDDEAIIVDCLELVSNQNEAITNDLGYTERSSHKENMVPMNTLGKFKVHWEKHNVEFEVGTGFTAAQRDAFWSKRNDLIGSKITFKYQSLGPNLKPRFPVFLGIRTDL